MGLCRPESVTPVSAPSLILAVLRKCARFFKMAESGRVNHVGPNRSVRPFRRNLTSRILWLVLPGTCIECGGRSTYRKSAASFEDSMAAKPKNSDGVRTQSEWGDDNPFQILPPGFGDLGPIMPPNWWQSGIFAPPPSTPAPGSTFEELYNWMLNSAPSTEKGFLTPEQAAVFLQERRNVVDFLGQLDDQYAQQSLSADQAKRDIRKRALENQNRSAWDSASRGIERSSIRDVALADIDATATLEQSSLDDRLNLVDAQNQTNKLQKLLGFQDMQQSVFDPQRIENQKNLPGSTQPEPPPPPPPNNGGGSNNGDGSNPGQNKGLTAAQIAANARRRKKVKNVTTRIKKLKKARGANPDPNPNLTKKIKRAKKRRATIKGRIVAPNPNTGGN